MYKKYNFKPVLEELVKIPRNKLSCFFTSIGEVAIRCGEFHITLEPTFYNLVMTCKKTNSLYNINRTVYHTSTIFIFSKLGLELYRCYKDLSTNLIKEELKIQDLIARDI